MKKFLFIALGFSVITSKAQNIEFSTKLDIDFQLTGEYVNTLGEHIRYEKVLDDKILRLEENRIALFDQEFTKLWNLELETVKSVGGDNYYYITSDSDHIFIVQFGAAFRSSGAESQLTCINLQGESKSIILSEKIELRGINGMEVIDGNLHLVYSSTTGSTNPYSKGLELYTSIAIINSELEYVGSIFNLPSHLEEDPKYNTVWYYNEMDGGNIVLNSFYYLSPKGKYSQYSSEGAQYYEMTIMIDKNNSLVSNESVKVDANDGVLYSSTYTNPIKFNPNIFDVKIGTQKFTQFRINNLISKLYVKKDSLSSGNIIERFFEITKLNTGAVRTFNSSYARVIDVVEDPLNNKVNVILISETGVRYLITLNSDMKVSFVHEYKTCYKPFHFASVGSNFTNGFDQVSSTWGTLPADHVPNAFDLAMKLTERCQFTVVNYSDYQLLFTDNKSTKEAKVYKVVR